MTTMLAIAAVDALKPAPFAVNPMLALTLKSQLGTPARYIKLCDPAVDIDDLEADARALETIGEISSEDLETEWKIDQDAIDAAEAQFEGDLEDAAYTDNGMPEPEIDMVQEVEPLV